MTSQLANATDQRAGVAPIAFVLDDRGWLGDPVTLQIRPEDLTRAEASRVAVHQTLGRETVGWADNFGRGLPTVTIAGHTGWRTATGSGMDGAMAFDTLNTLVMHDYHDAKQACIDIGQDPADVKLLFVDTLNGYAYSVVPLQFSLKRSKSRPLLYQYSMVMQVISTRVDGVQVDLPETGNMSNGIISLDLTMTDLVIETKEAESDTASIFGGLAGEISDFTSIVNGVITQVISLIKTPQDLATRLANELIGVASDLASVGLNVFRAMNAIRTLPTGIAASISQVASAYNEMVCIFANSLSPRPVFDSYGGLYGASNCSSTTGGRPNSPFAGLNVFSLITDRGTGTMSVSSAAAASIAALRAMDPVLAPMTSIEIERHLSVINAGVVVA